MNNNNQNEFQLFDIENQNMNTSLDLFEIIKETAEEYCTYVKKYKEYTAMYFEKLSKLTYNNKKEIKNKKINISPFFAIINKVPKLIEQQIESLKNFVNTFDYTIKPLEDVLKNELNNLEEPKKDFEENKKKYQKNINKHKKLMDSLSSIEKKLVKYQLNKKGENKDKNEVKEQIRSSLNETISLEKDYLKLNKNGENLHWLFQEDSLRNIDKIKLRTRTVFENLNNNVIFFLFFFNQFYSPTVSFIKKEIDQNETNPLDIKNLINNNMKIKTFKLEDLPSDKYDIKILQNIEIESLSYSFDSIDLKENDLKKYGTFSFFKFMSKKKISKDDYISQLNKRDVFLIVKKLYKNFKMINRNKYDLKIEEEKINTKIIADKLLQMKKCKDKKNEKVEKINDEEKKKILELIPKNENRLVFLKRLNKVRTYGRFEYNKAEFDDIVQIFLNMLDKILTDKDIFSFNFSLILSQTFYYVEKKVKHYIFKYIKSHPIYKSEEIWQNLIEYGIKEEKEKFNTLLISLPEKRKEAKFKEMVFAQLLAITKNMVDFDLEINKIENITTSYMNKYNLKDNSKQIILNIIENKKNNNNDIKIENDINNIINEEINLIKDNQIKEENKKEDNIIIKEEIKTNKEEKKEDNTFQEEINTKNEDNIIKGEKKANEEDNIIKEEKANKEENIIKEEININKEEININKEEININKEDNIVKDDNTSLKQEKRIEDNSDNINKE